MANPQPQDVLGRLTLVTGPEEFLGERAIAAVAAGGARARRGGRVLRDDGGLADHGRARRPGLALVVLRHPLRRRARPRGPARGVRRPACSTTPRAPAEDVALRAGPRRWARRAAACSPSCASSASVTEVKSAPLTAREFPGFVVNELRARKVRIDPDAADFLIQAVGQDLRSLSAAASQLANDFEGQPLTVEMVKKYFGGRAEAKSFAVADHTLYGHTAKALEELRWALDRGTAPVLVTSAMAGGLRSLAKFMSAPRGMRNNDLMREVGVPGVEAGRRCASSRTAGTPTAWAGRSARSRGPTPTSRARPATRRTRWRRWCSTSSAPGPRAASRPRRTAQRRRPGGTTPRAVAGLPQSEAAFFWMADLRLAAWFLWMTPLEAALSSCWLASSRRSLGLVGVAGLGGLAELAHGGLQRGLHGLVALVRSVVLPVALDLGLDVRHVRLASFDGVVQVRGVRTRVQTRRETISAGVRRRPNRRAHAA